MSDLVKKLRSAYSSLDTQFMAADRIEELEAKLAACEKDSRRIDWLEMHPRNAEIVVDGKSEPCLYYAVAGAFGVRLRDIIDASMGQNNEH